MMPHRKVTLLFPEQDEEQLAARLLDASLSLSHLLHLPLYVVDVSQRSRECRECGFLATSASGPAHVFPWPQAEAQRHLQMAKQWQQHRGAPTPLRIASSSAAAAASDTLPRAAHGPARASKAAAPSAAALPGDGMCNSWRKTKTCPRKDSGRQLCGFKEYAVPVKHCFGFAKGHCEFGAGCKFPHVVGPQLAAGAAADAGAAAAAAASSLDAAAVASASLAPSADSVGVVAASTVAPSGPLLGHSRHGPSVGGSVAFRSLPQRLLQHQSRPPPSAVPRLSEPTWQTVPASHGRKRKNAAEDVAPAATRTVAATSWASMVDEEEEEKAAAAASSSSVTVTPQFETGFETPPALVRRQRRSSLYRPPQTPGGLGSSTDVFRVC